MTALLYGIIQTTAYNNRFELGPNQPTDEVAVFASVHHPNQVAIADDAAGAGSAHCERRGADLV